MTASALPSFPDRFCEVCEEPNRHFLRDSELLICFDCWQSGIHQVIRLRESSPAIVERKSDPYPHGRSWSCSIDNYQCPECRKARELEERI